ncbi:uncharacterized protein N7500_005848 [Penicillium coprophilum]|uniref:uncharacterized protein n=1 Tax=Penicillium coprophilum TaxID=36646 RepID=UPI0023A55B76|nr:uncharacterized protein N7500_005848 [Penicillium coprophilum]KAJ5164018.1 hypothetical protein N7500_005848 [Penicillium coprophilum]
MRPTGHRRHHTWPQCGSELCMRGPHGLEVHVFNPFGGPTTYAYIPLSLQRATVAPLRTEELLCGDMGMPELSRQPKRIPRFWFQSSTGRSNQSSRSGSSGQTKQAYRSVLRRLARRPPLSKTRSLFVVPSNTTSNDSYLMSEFIPHRDLNEQAQNPWLKDDIGGVILNNHAHGENRALHCGHFRNMKND